MASENSPMVSVVIPTHNRLQSLKTLLDSLDAHDYPKEQLEIIVVNDASPDDTAAYCRNNEQIIFIDNQTPVLLSAARNQGACMARGKYIFFIDDDNVLPQGTIKSLVDCMEQESEVGLVGPMMHFYSKQDAIWCSGAFLRKPFYMPGHMTDDERQTLIQNKAPYFECDYLPNAYMIRKEVFEEIEGFDELNFPMGWEDIDFGYRVRQAGHKVVIFPGATIWHDCPVTTEFHLSTKRCYLRGRGKTFFYRNVCPWRLLLTPIDIAGFLHLLFRYEKESRMKKFLAYLKGIGDGLLKRQQEARLLANM